MIWAWRWSWGMGMGIGGVGLLHFDTNIHHDFTGIAFSRMKIFNIVTLLHTLLPFPSVQASTSLQHVSIYFPHPLRQFSHASHPHRTTTTTVNNLNISTTWGYSYDNHEDDRDNDPQPARRLVRRVSSIAVSISISHQQE